MTLLEESNRTFGCLSPSSEHYSRMMVCSNEQLLMCIDRDVTMSDLGRYILKKIYSPTAPPPYEHHPTAPPSYESDTPASAPPEEK